MSNAVGKKLKVTVSKNESSISKEILNTSPETMAFPTDGAGFYFNNREYDRHFKGAQKMNEMTVTKYNEIVNSMKDGDYNIYLCADANGNVKGGTITLDNGFGKLIHSDNAMAVNLGDMMIIGKANGASFVKILPLNDAKTKTSTFPGTYGLMVPNDKEKLDKCVTDIDQTCFRCYTGTFNANNCLWYGYYMYCNIGRPAEFVDGETCLLRVANIGVEGSTMLIHQTVWSSLDPSKCFYRIIKTTDRNVYEPPTTTYGEWQKGTGGEEVSSEGTLPHPISMLERKDYNLNNYRANGVYYGGQTMPQVQYTNTPFGTSVYQFILEVRDLGGSVIFQNYYGFNSSGEANIGEYTRYYAAGTWTSWRKVARDVTLSGTLPSGTAIGTLSVNGASTVLRVPNYTLPTASSSTKGGITLGYTENGKNYPIELDSSGKAFVNVPWTDTKVTVDSTLSSSSTNPVQNKVINSALSGKANTSHTHTISQISDLQANWDTYLKANPTLINNAINLTDEDLNDYSAVSDCGYYYAAGGNSVSNAPSAIDSFGMIVLRSANGVVQQLLCGQVRSDDNSSHLFIRRWHNAWSPWDEITLKSDLTWTNISGKPSSFYTLPTASASTLGGVKVGAGLRITNGVLSATGGGTADSVDWSNIDNKPSSFTPSTHTHAASQVTGLTANRALVSDASGHPAVSAVTNTELGYLDGVTSSIQTQLNGKAASSHTHNAFTGATSSTAGSTGFVPAPASGNQNKYLRGDGTWQTPPDTNTTYSIATASTAGLVKPASVITKPTINSTSTTSGRYYHVQMSSDGNMFVNVPWENTTYDLASNLRAGLLRQLSNDALDTLHGNGNWGRSVVSCTISSTDNSHNLLFKLNTTKDVTGTAIAYVVSINESIQIPANKSIALAFADGTELRTSARTTQAVTLSPDNDYLFVRGAGSLADRCNIIGLYSASVNNQNIWTAYQDFTSGAGNSGSDMRFKSEVENINSTLDDINKINVIKYIWEHPDEKDVKYTFGVNADDLINLGGIYATIVHHRQDKYDTKWVEYDRFGVLAIKGLQELNKKLEDKCAKYEKIIGVLADKCGVNIDEL